MDQLLGIESQNKRAQHIKRFLSKPPERAAYLVMHAAGPEPLQLEEWTRPEVVPGLVHDIESTMEAHAAEANVFEQVFTLSYLTESRQVVTQKAFRIRRIVGDDASDSARTIDGSATSQIAQMQSHLQAMTRMYLTGHQAQLMSLFQLTEKLTEKLVSNEERSDRREDVVRELREAIVELRIAGAEQNNGEMNEAQSRAIGMLEKILPAIAMSVAQSQGAGKGQ